MKVDIKIKEKSTLLEGRIKLQPELGLFAANPPPLPIERGMQKISETRPINFPVTLVFPLIFFCQKKQKL